MTYSEEDLRKRIYAFNYEQWRDVCTISRYSDRKLTVQELENGIILPLRIHDASKGEYSGGVCDGDFNFVAGLFRGKPPGGGWYSVAVSYRAEEKDIVDVDADVIYGGVLLCHFGHFILECFGRLWYLLKAAPENNRKVVFVINGKPAQWHYDFLELLGMPRESFLILGRPARFRSVTIPEESVHSWYNFTKEHLLPYRRMVERAGEPERVKDLLERKIFLTRSGLAKTETICCNEEYFEKFYASKGFILVEPEKFSAAEQVAILSHAEEVACILGSLSHWAIFCRPGTRFTMLTRVNNDTLGSQCLVNEASEVDWRIVDVSMNFLYARRDYGVCLIGPTPYWKEFVLDTYGEFQEDEGWKCAYHEYLLLWTDYFLLDPTQVKRIQRTDPVLLFEGMNRALYQNEFPVDVLEKRRGRPFLVCQAKCRGSWLPKAAEGHPCGAVGEDPLEGIKLQFSSPFLRIRYEVFSPEYGWRGMAVNGETAEILNEEGMAQPIYGIRIWLEGKDRPGIRLRVRACGIGIGWSDWITEEAVSIATKVPLCDVVIKVLMEGERTK